MTDTPSSPKHPVWQTWCAAACVALVALTVFFASTRFGFVGFDDDTNVFNNPHLNPVTKQTIPFFWSESYFELYTPVTYSLWSMVADLPTTKLSSPEPVFPAGMTSLAGQPFHLLGVGLHVLNSVLVFFLIARLPLLRKFSPVYAALGATFWAVHPLQAEPVSWITGHNNVFSGTLMLVALLAVTGRIEAQTKAAQLGWYMVATALYALALLAKPTAAALPMVAFALAVGAYRQSPRSLLFPLGTWFIIAAGCLFVTRNTSEKLTDVSLPLWQRPFVIGDALAFYIGKIVAPIHLGLDYGRQPDWLRGQNWFYAMWLIPVALGAVLLLWYRRSKDKDVPRTVLAGFAIFVLGALPMLGIAPYYFHRYSTVADRYVYIALIGVAIGIAVAVAYLPKRLQTVGIGISASLIIFFAALSYQQSLVWQDSYHLFTHAAKINSGSQLAHFNLSLVLQARGEAERGFAEINRAAECRPEGQILTSRVFGARAAFLFNAGRYAESIQDSKRAIALAPSQYLPYINLAIALREVGDKKAALATLEAAAVSSGKREDNLYSIAREMLNAGKFDLAEPFLIEAASGTKYAAEANFLLGIQATKESNDAAAERYLRAAVESKPSWGEANFTLAEILKRRGKTAESKTYYAKAADLGYGAKAPKSIQ